MRQQTGSRRWRWLRLAGGGFAAVGLMLGSGGTALAGPASGSAPSGCGWTAHSLPHYTSPEWTAGGVLGTDGGRRFAGYTNGRAAIWQDGRLTDLGPGYALDVNRGGVAVGYTWADPFQHASMWRGGRQVPLAEPPEAFQSGATGINDAGLIVGWADVPVPGSVSAGRDVLLWSVDAPQRVRRLPGAAGASTLTAVTTAGRVVGNSGGVRAFAAVAKGAEPVPAGALTGTVASGLRPLASPDPGGTTYAYAAAGRYTVGDEWLPDGQDLRAVRWTGGRPERLSGYQARGVNVHGVAVGTVQLPEVLYTAAVWSVSGIRTTLPPLVPGAIAIANVISDSGVVAGLGRDAPDPDGHEVPVLWTCR